MTISKEAKISIGLGLIVGMGGAIHSAAAQQIYDNPAITNFMSGYQHDITLPFSMYFAMKVGYPSESLARAGICLTICYAAEFYQLVSGRGTFDWKDFLAYTAGTALAFAAEKAIFRQPKSLDKIVEETTP